MADWTTGYVEGSDGLRFHYARTGGGGPPVVLAHGFSDDGSCWTPVARALAPEYDVVMVDARGHGLSDAPEAGYGVD
ncbi:MAG TPA: alpha/beta fold hydrolase, partial [Armatimonadaceae bacterium]|nr:alpha/beta fold hydrolase [Armatimonadaceae bacterium]